MTARRWLLAIPLTFFAILGPAQASEVRDRAKMFSDDAIRKAESILDRAEKQSRVPTIIETVPSLGGTSISEASLQRAKESGIKGVFVLISKKPAKLEARDYQNFLGRARLLTIQEAFLSNFRAGDLDAGLIQGAETIGEAVKQVGAPRGGRAGRRPVERQVDGSRGRLQRGHVGEVVPPGSASCWSSEP